MLSLDIFRIQNLLINAFSLAIEPYGIFDVVINIERPKEEPMGFFMSSSDVFG